MATYLITGGAGFIGSHIVAHLAARGETVRVLDNFSTGKRENVAAFGSAVDMYEGDIRDAADVDTAVSGADYVLHQAALASVPRSIEDPVSTTAVNLNGTLNLLDAARRHGVKRFVYASSSSIYGDSETLPKREDMTPAPKSPYAVSKLGGEWYCRVFGECYGLTTVSLRYFNVFGPRQDPTSQYAAVIPIFASTLLDGGRPTIFGDGEQSRDFTYVDNVVAANLLACDGETTGAAVYNVACGDRFSLNELYERLQKLLGTDVLPVYADPRPGDVKHSQAAIEAVVDALGYRTLIDFDDGLEKTVNWYKEHRESS